MGRVVVGPGLISPVLRFWEFGFVCLSPGGAAGFLGSAAVSPGCLEEVCVVCVSLGVGAECLVSVTDSQYSADI